VGQGGGVEPVAVGLALGVVGRCCLPVDFFAEREFQRARCHAHGVEDFFLDQLDVGPAGYILDQLLDDEVAEVRVLVLRDGDEFDDGGLVRGRSLALEHLGE